MTARTNPDEPRDPPNTTTSPAHRLTLYGLRWNPFASGVPVEGLYYSPRFDAFGRRYEMYLRDGGFAMLTGAPGGGKSWALRILDDRLSRMRKVVVRSIDHLQSGISDFYRELGDLFGVSLTPRNRWGGFKAIREKWQAHVDATLIRPVLVIDEAQEMPSVERDDRRGRSSSGGGMAVPRHRRRRMLHPRRTPLRVQRA